MPPTAPRLPTATSVLLLWGGAALGCGGQDGIGPDTTDSGGTHALDCDGGEVPWPAEQRAREAQVFEGVNALRTTGIDADGSLCDGAYRPAVEPAVWHEGIAKNLQCGLWRDRVANKQFSDWNIVDLAAGTDLLVTTSYFEDCGHSAPQPQPGCIWFDLSGRDDPVPEWFAHDDGCWFPMSNRYDVGAVGVSAWGDGEVWYLVLAYRPTSSSGPRRQNRSPTRFRGRLVGPMRRRTV